MPKIKHENILSIDPPYAERERKLSMQSGPRTLRDVLDYVLGASDHYAPPPARIAIDMPREVTGLRERVYFVDEELKCLSASMEFRQEVRQKYGVKQTIKVGATSADGQGLLTRVEHPARLKNFGIDLTATQDAKLQKQTKKLFGDGATFKPVVRMLSQRTKLVYHPAGAPDTAIELGFDIVCRGQTFFGFEWSAPQLELELVKGDDAQVLEDEERRLMARFALQRDTTSKPHMGFAALVEGLSVNTSVQRLFQDLSPNTMW